MMIRRPWLAVILWTFCVAMGVLVEITVIDLYSLWTIQGIMSVRPWVYTLVDSLPLLVAGGMFTWLIYAFADGPGNGGGA